MAQRKSESFPPMQVQPQQSNPKSKTSWWQPSNDHGWWMAQIPWTTLKQQDPHQVQPQLTLAAPWVWGNLWMLHLICQLQMSKLQLQRTQIWKTNTVTWATDVEGNAIKNPKNINKITTTIVWLITQWCTKILSAWRDNFQSGHCSRIEGGSTKLKSLLACWQRTPWGRFTIELKGPCPSKISRQWKMPRPLPSLHTRSWGPIDQVWMDVQTYMESYMACSG